MKGLLLLTGTVLYAFYTMCIYALCLVSVTQKEARKGSARLIFNLYLSSGTLELDGHMPLEEKKKEMERILAEYPEDFEYFVPNSKPTKHELQKMQLVEYRLELLASWLLQGEKQNKEYPVMSGYAEKRNRNTQYSYERLMDRLEGGDKDKQW